MSFWTDLERHGATIALVDDDGMLSYAELAAQADDVAAEARTLLSASVERPLVLIEMSSTRAAMIAYLAAVRAGWPIIIDGPRDEDQQPLAARFGANLICRNGADRFAMGSSTPITLHPELCLMLSTSGTTGAAKLVRLSRDNVASNAESIARYLAINSNDRAITTLPAYYSYGLSVLHSYLHAGARIVLTEHSLIDDEFWAQSRAHGVTSLALVPAQFELLDARAFRRSDLPTVRYITQAGGKLDPATAQRFATQAVSEGWELVIMYGQTEAGPRIAYLPPADALTCYDTIGRAIPGGELWLEDVDGVVIASTDVAGELVYSGPGVMMGYATTPEELSAPAMPPVLRTGDVAVRTEQGYWRIVGRNSRFLKLFGLRIGLDEVEQTLRSEGFPVRASGSDRGLVLFTTDASNTGDLRNAVADRWNLPRTSVRAEGIDHFPLLPSGKLDYRTLKDRADALLAQDPAGVSDDVDQIVTNALRGRKPDLDRSFAEQGPDSLAYLNVRLALEERMSVVPDDWDQIPLSELYNRTAGPASTPSRTMRVPADAVGRMLALLAVIMMHTTDWPTNGGAYVLMLLSGYSLARFQLAPLTRGEVTSTLRTMLVPLVPIYIAILLFLTSFRAVPGWQWWVLAGNLVPPPIDPPSLEPYWFICAYVQGMVLLTAPFLIPGIRRQVAASPWRAVLFIWIAVIVIAWVGRLDAIDVGIRHRNPLGAVALMVTGGVVALTKDQLQKWVATGAVLLFCALLWRDGWPSVLLFLLLVPLAVIWTPLVTLPRALARVVLTFANASLYVYVLHVPVISMVVRVIPQNNIAWFSAVAVVTVLVAVLVERLIDTWRQHRLQQRGLAARVA